MTTSHAEKLADLAADPDRGMLNLLGQVNAMSSSRDREQMTLRLVTAMRDVLGASSVVLYAVSASAHGPVGALVAEASPGDAAVCGEDDEYPPILLEADGFLLGAVRADDGVLESREGGYRLALAMGDRGNPHALLVAACPIAPEPRVRDAFVHVAHFYQNQLDLLDYAELDTLTHLLNRKTFDENFDRFIASVGRTLKRDAGERRAEDVTEQRPSWLGVIDVDKFKRINDTFGHLFGDEVLLRLAELMKKNFRLRDKLFRFGGEEFVVLLRHVSEADAHAIFDRFREAVEAHEFPQVGQVTASLGYTRIDPALPPAEMIAHADEALYFSKQNGRNQINSYENLVAQGLLEVKAPPQAENTDLQADIDALFD